MLGREMPPLPKKVVELPPRERHEAARDAMMEAVLHDADATLGFIQWVDSVTPDMTRDEVFAGLEMAEKSALKGMPKETAKTIRAWSKDMMKAWDEVRAIGGDPVMARAHANVALRLTKRDGLKAGDVLGVSFHPFCVELVLSAEKFDAVSNHIEPIGGFYKPGTSFEFIREVNIPNTVDAHELGHRLIDRAPSHGSGDPIHTFANTLRPLKNFPNAPDEIRDFFLESSLRSTGEHALDRLHNEFLAEMNVARREGTVEHERDWSSAERFARAFPEKVHALVADMQGTPELVARLEHLAHGIVPRFERAKEGVITALRIASRLEDTSARDFVAAAMLVMPVRSYHHLPKVMRKKYGEEAVAGIMSDERDESLRDIALHKFGDVVDNIWQTGVAGNASIAEEISRDPLRREAFLYALQMTFDMETYDEDLSTYLKLRDRRPTRAEVLASPMAEFVRAAGMEKEFVAMVDSVLPA